jgi:hypothetical protein
MREVNDTIPLLRMSVRSRLTPAKPAIAANQDSALAGYSSTLVSLK